MDPSVKHVWMLAAARPISRFAQDCISLLLPPFPIHFCLLLVEVNEPGVFRIAKYYGSVLFFHFRFLSFPLACCSYASLFTQAARTMVGGPFGGSQSTKKPIPGFHPVSFPCSKKNRIEKLKKQNHQSVVGMQAVSPPAKWFPIRQKSCARHT